MNVKKIICLYGGPGVGKSTVCAGLFYFLKMRGYECEMNREYVKEWIWEKRPVHPGDQPLFFAKQSRRERLYIRNEMDFIITDSPLILTHFYGMDNDPVEQKYNTSFKMLEHHHGFCKDNGYKVDHFLLTRCKAYSEKGRFQNEDEAKQKDKEIASLLNDFGINYTSVPSDERCVQRILEKLEN